MELKLDIEKVTKVVMKKDDNTYIEFNLNNGVIEDVNVIERETEVQRSEATCPKSHSWQIEALRSRAQHSLP